MFDTDLSGTDRAEALSTGLLRHFFTSTDATYGYRRIHADLVDEGQPPATQ